MSAHHLLANEAKDVLVFGDKATFPYVSTAPLILAYGTFNCVFPWYTQLDIFHLVVANNLAVPALLFLVKGKTKETCLIILRLAEEIAENEGTPFFNRPVTIMSDFEAGFIHAVQELYPSVSVTCCFFHYVQNIRKTARPVMTKIKKGEGETSLTFKLAQKTKRRFMMLPLLQEELITSEVIDIILAHWKAKVPDRLQTAFRGITSKVLGTYVGAPPGSKDPPAPASPQIWSVSARSVRTNNGAESLHSELNQKSKGRLNINRFLAIMEEQMDRAWDRITMGASLRRALPYWRRTIFSRSSSGTL